MTKEELIDKTDSAIAELVHEKTKLQKAYNYYNGIRDKEQFRYLEENFGIKSPTSVEFTPLIKKHIDALIGEFLGTPIIPKISCKDSETISKIDREKQLKIYQEVSKYLKNKLISSILYFIDQKSFKDINIEQELIKLKENLETDFVSEYEVASQYVVQYIMQNRRTDLITKLRFALLDLLIAGYCTFRVKASSSNTNVEIEVLDPRNVFIDRNVESVYIKDSYRVVIRKWMSRDQILNKYGKKLSAKDVEEIKSEWKNHFADYNSTTITARVGERFAPPSEDLDNGIAIEAGYPDEFNNRWTNDILPVYEVEWLETDNDFVMQRYSTIRIAESIYILEGKDKNVIRSKDNPTYCGLSVNGIYFTNRSNKPYSLMLACMSLQDKYDLLNYIRDNLIASSGSVGDYVDFSMLPSWLGQKPTERLQKYLAYKKNGIAIIDTAQEGRLASGQAPMNTIFNGYDDTIKVQAIQAIQIAIDSIEQTTSSITGVFRERLNGIEQRDAVTNVKQGAANSFIITKQYYQQMDIVTAEMLLDALNVAKSVYKNGLTGTIILGDKYQKIFTALPEYFTLSDHDIHIITSTDVMQDLQTIKSLIPEFIKSGSVDPEIVFEAMTSKSMTDLKQKAILAIRKQKQENNVVAKLQQQLDQGQQQLQELQKQLQSAQTKIEQLNQQKLQIESEKNKQDAKIAWYEAQTDRDYKTKQAETDKRKIEIEYLQLADGNPYNDKVNFNK